MQYFSKGRLIASAALINFFSYSVNAETLMLYRPGQSSMEWLITEHAGAAGLRGGKDCKECHADGLFQNSADAELVKKAELSIDTTRGHLLVNIAIDPADGSADIAVLIGSNKERSFARIGCWAACHSDMKSMDQDMGLGKYLSISRSKLVRSGGGDKIKRKADLDMLRFQGRYLEMWRIKVERGKLKTLWQEDLLAESKRLRLGALQASTKLSKEALTIKIKRPLKVADNLIHFQEGEGYVLGLAILSQEPPPPVIEVDMGTAAQSSGMAESEREAADNMDASDADAAAESGADTPVQSDMNQQAESPEKSGPLELDPKLGPMHWVSYPIPFDIELPSR